MLLVKVNKGCLKGTIDMDIDMDWDVQDFSFRVQFNLLYKRLNICVSIYFRNGFLYQMESIKCIKFCWEGNEIETEEKINLIPKIKLILFFSTSASFTSIQLPLSLEEHSFWYIWYIQNGTDLNKSRKKWEFICHDFSFRCSKEGRKKFQFQMSVTNSVSFSFCT